MNNFAKYGGKRQNILFIFDDFKIISDSIDTKVTLNNSEKDSEDGHEEILHV
jgi:hypothetical protein